MSYSIHLRVDVCEQKEVDIIRMVVSIKNFNVFCSLCVSFFWEMIDLKC